MTLKTTELDVGFIRDQGGLTKDEDKALSDFLKKRQLKYEKHFYKQNNYGR